MTAILYIRVSSDEQVKNNSLESQERICREYATRLGYEIVKVFKDEGESAKTTDRPQLQNLLSFISKNKIDAIIFYRIDRWARNAEDYTALRLIAKRYGISLKSATENINDTPSGKFTENVLSAVAQLDNDVRSERTTTGMKQSLLHGFWCWRAHLGYQREKYTAGKSILVPSAESPFIVKAFTLAESGLYTQVGIVKELKKDGFNKLNEKRLNEVLRNPIYAGIIIHKWLTEPVTGVHQPLISKNIFDKVQLILNGKRPQITPHKRNHPDFPLRNFIRCVKCGNKLTGSWSRGRNGDKYPYYRCFSKGCGKSAKKGELEHRFQEHLKFYQPNKDTLELFGAILLDVWKTKQSTQINDQSKIKKDLSNLLIYKKRLNYLLTKGTMDEENYKSEMKEINDKIATKQIELNEMKTGLGNNFEDCLNYCKLFMSDFATHWTNGDINLKQRFQTLIFPDKIYYEDETFRTTATALIFKQLQGKRPDLSSLVAPTGFEPVFSA
jgi:DNA invertase Pin-like site-specific DNA recombinase